MTVKVIGLIIGILILCFGIYYLGVLTRSLNLDRIKYNQN